MESRADISGSDSWAAAGYGPWGLVWLFQDFTNAHLGTQLVSDHPSNAHRIQALEQHFADNPAVFGKFNPAPRSATPISVPKNGDENLLR